MIDQMKLTIFLLIVISAFVLPVASYGQGSTLISGKIIDKKMLKGENHLYTISLKKGEYAECVVMQKGVDLAIDVIDPSGGKMRTLDSPNGTEGPEPISIEAVQTGKYELHIYPLVEGQTGMADSIKTKWSEENQGDYVITDFIKLSPSEYKQKLAKIQEDKNVFQQWINNNVNELKTVDAGNGFEDLEPFKSLLKDVRVVALGEASHGTSEFFRMKHRLLEFLVKEMGFTSFYIEASMTRCRYVNDYVLNGIGDPDTATAIQGFPCWRVEEVKNMIGWMRQYNASVPDEKKVKFFGCDLQINDQGWKELKDFYRKVNIQKLVELDSLEIHILKAVKLAVESWPRLTDEQRAFLKAAYLQSLVMMDDIVVNEGKYEFLTGKNIYDRNLMNIKLILHELETRQDIGGGIRDYYMAENIFYLLNQEKPNAKVVLWAHNSHIAKDSIWSVSKMGNHLANILKAQFYAIGFEFYSGSFQTRNLDINNKSQTFDVMTVGTPPVESLPWYFDKAGKDKFFIDFRNTGADKIKNFSQPYEMHSFGSMHSAKWSDTLPSSLANFDGMIYIKESTAAKNFTKVDIKSR